MLKVVLALTLLVCCTSAIDNVLLIQCNSTFVSNIAKTTGTQCPNLITLNKCLTDVIVKASPTSLGLITTGAQTIIDYALGLKLNCDLSTLPFTSGTENIAFELAQGHDVAITQYTQELASVLDSFDDLASVDGQKAAMQASIDSQSSSAQANLLFSTDNLVGLSERMFASSIAALTDRVTAMNTRLSALNNNAANIVNTIASPRAVASTALANEAAARSTIAAAWASAMNPLDTAITSKTALAASDRSTMRASRPLNNPATAIASRYSSQTISEATRATSEASIQSTAFATLSTNYGSSLSSQFLAQSARSDSTCVVRTTVPSLRPPALSGSLDEQPCTTTAAGTLYFSTARKVLYVCTGANYIPFLPGFFSQTSSFGCSVVLNNLRMQRLVHQLFGRTSNFNRCHLASSDGYSSGTMHSRCDNKGKAALTLVRTGDGRVIGGYIPSKLTQRGWWYSPKMFIFRFSPISGYIELLFPVGYSNSNGYYDNASYGAYFGSATGDFRVESNLQSGYTYAYTYSNQYLNFWTTSTWSSWFTNCPSCMSVSACEQWVQF